MIKKTTRRFKHIEEALGHLSAIERLTSRVAYLKQFIDPTSCALCGQDTDLETFCFGCLDFICNVCQPPDQEEFIVAGPHTLDDHKEARAEMQAVSATGTGKAT